MHPPHAHPADMTSTAWIEQDYVWLIEPIFRHERVELSVESEMNVALITIIPGGVEYGGRA